MWTSVSMWFVLGSVSMGIVVEGQQNRYETTVIPIYVLMVENYRLHEPVCISRFM